MTILHLYLKTLSKRDTARGRQEYRHPVLLRRFSFDESLCNSDKISNVDLQGLTWRTFLTPLHASPEFEGYFLKRSSLEFYPNNPSPTSVRKVLCRLWNQTYRELCFQVLVSFRGEK